MLVGCGRACKLLQTTKGSTATSCPVTRAYQTSYAHFKASNTETCMITLSVADVSKTFKQADYKDMYSEHVLTNWQVSSLTFSTCP